MVTPAEIRMSKGPICGRSMCDKSGHPLRQLQQQSHMNNDTAAPGLETSSILDAFAKIPTTRCASKPQSFGALHE